MAVLKSFELEGNKLSFANWISNLSPTCTPFTCMINKEKVDQTQYQWQTDALAPATADTFEEGSQAELQPRAKTEVLSNFTATIRRAVNVSHTNEAVAAYGRKDELMYQLGKAGKEVMRDIEFANLSKTVGRIGSTDEASQYSGFKALVAGVDVPAIDTHAIVHKEIPAFSTEDKIFTLKRIFDITTNLYIAGSKANKIMFHPKHMFIFNDHIAYNDELPHVHRMFDSMDDKYNALISQIKDPVGRLYSLIPNRFMPEDSMYFFHEDDWTQMVLRPPQRIKLGKTGSSHTVLVETELGLRHKHPFASGVLSYAVVSRKGDLTTDKRILTAGVAIGDHATFDMVVVDANGTEVPSLPIQWDISDDKILRIDPPEDTTSSSGHISGQVIPKEIGFATIRAHGNRTLSNTIEYEVRAPVKELTYDNKDMGMGQRITFTANVKMNEPADAPVPDGVEVVWRSSSDNIIFVSDTTGAYVGTTTTVATVNGEAKIKIAAKAQGTYSIWYTVDGVASPHRTITVGSAGLGMKWTAGKETVTNAHSKDVKYEIEIKDRDGNLVGVGTPVNWSTSNVGVLSVSDETSLVDANGKATINVNPVSVGTAIVIADCYGDKAEFLVQSKPVIVEASVTPNTAPINEKVDAVALVMDAEGTPIQGQRVLFTALPAASAEFDGVIGTTDANGQYTTKVKGLKQGVVDVRVTAGAITSAPVQLNVGQGARIDFVIDPTPTQIGMETTLRVNVTAQDGTAIIGKTVTFTSNPPNPAFDTITGDTDASGNFEDKFTPLFDQDMTVTAHVSGFTDTSSARLTFEDRVLTYSVSGDDKKMTVGVNKNHHLTFTVRNQGVAVKDEVVEYTISDPSKATLAPMNGGRTNGLGQNEVVVTPLAKGNFTITAKVAGKTTPYTTGLLRIADPTVTLTIAPNPVKLSQITNIKATVKDANGDLLSGIPVSFNCSPDFLTPMTGGNTNASGVYEENKTASDEQTREIYAFLTNYPAIQSKIVSLSVDDSLYDHSFQGHDTPITVGMGVKREVTTNVKDGGGANMVNLALEFINETPSLMTINNKINDRTDAWGNHILEVEGHKEGIGIIKTKAVGDRVYKTIEIDLRNPTLAVGYNPIPAQTNLETNFTAMLLDHDGQGVRNKRVSFVTTAPVNPALSPAITDTSGSASTSSWIIRPGNYKMYGYLTDNPEVRTGEIDIQVADRPYTFETTGVSSGRKATVGIPREIVVTVKENGIPVPYLDIVYRNNTSDVISMDTQSGTTDANGQHSIIVTALKAGMGAIDVKAEPNVGGWFAFPVMTGTPNTIDLRVFKNGTAFTGNTFPGDNLEFVVTLHENDGASATNVPMRFEHDRMMFNGQWQIGVRNTDNFGKINVTGKIGGIGQLSIKAYIDGFPDTVTPTRTVTSVF